ncbi:hypothetical protein EUGRSUZ_C02182 [Eucalyptus grandis]|uniref:Uncharacterized protein n=2 Tax=Eucalyptus grandis TaxID=71139 RepID=A0A059CRH0_EUCGR|nr:hypothetical protein EUGRSUZ_C02182 [Eucalyptus grandis]
MAFTLTEAEPTNNKLQDQWINANKVCRHTIISTLFNELFDVHCPYKEAKQIWNSMTIKYTAEDVGRQKFLIGNYYRWEMSDDKEMKTQINKYHKLLPESWNDCKQQLKHKDKQLSLANLVVHIIIEDTTHKEIKATKAKEIATKANSMQGKPQHRQNRIITKNLITNPKLLTPPSKRRALALFVENQVNLVPMTLLGSVGVNVSFESDKIVMTNN